MNTAMNTARDSRRDTMDYSIREAAELAGVSKSTIQRALKNGKMSRNSEKRIDASELARLYPDIVVNTGEHSHDYSQSVPVGQRDYSHEHSNEHTEIKVLQVELKASQQMVEDRGKTIEDLRTRLDKSEDERTSAQTKLTALLTNMGETPPNATQKPARVLVRSTGFWVALGGVVGVLALVAIFLTIPALRALVGLP